MILDCDLLIGHDPATGFAVDERALSEALATAGIAGGALASLRSLAFDAESGTHEARAMSAPEHFPVAGIDLRDPIGGERVMERASAAGFHLVRFAPTRQGIAPHAPRTRILVRRATELGLTVLMEGGLSDAAGPCLGLGAQVVFLDAHFYDLGEFLLLAREEKGFHLSTRLLGNPDAWEIVAAQAGADRLVFGSRPGWFESAAVLRRLAVARLDPEAIRAVTEGNLRRLAGEIS